MPVGGRVGRVQASLTTSPWVTLGDSITGQQLSALWLSTVGQPFLANGSRFLSFHLSSLSCKTCRAFLMPRSTRGKWWGLRAERAHFPDLYIVIPIVSKNHIPCGEISGRQVLVKGMVCSWWRSWLGVKSFGAWVLID